MAEGEEPEQLVIRAHSLGNGASSNGGARQRDSRSGRVGSHGTLCYTKHLALMTAIGEVASDAEGVESRDVLADDQRVDIVGALVRVERLEVHHVADDGVLVNDARGAQDGDGRARRVGRYL